MVMDSLVELCRTVGKLPQKALAYRVSVALDAEIAAVFYTFAKSPGQAALAVCAVERVKDKELTRAAFEAMGVK